MSKETTAPPLKAVYVISFVALTLVAFVLYMVTGWVIAAMLSGPMQWSDLTKQSVPEVRNATMWNGKLCIPTIEVQMMNFAGMSAVLTLLEPGSEEVKVIRTHLPPADVALVPDGPVLWCLAGSMIYRVENDNVTETSTTTTLNLAESAFLYEGQLSVIQEVHDRVEKTSQHRLLSWNGTGWVDRGRVLLPRVGLDKNQGVIQTTSVDESDAQAVQRVFNGPVRIRVLNDNGKIHLFCSDHTYVLYSNRLEVQPDDAASAIAPENNVTPLPDWLSVGRHSQKFKPGLDAKGVLMAELDFDMRQRGPGTEITLKRLVDGTWKVDRKWERQGFAIDPQLVSDGKRAWVVNQTLGNRLAMVDVTDSETPETKLPMVGGATIQRLSQKMEQHSWWAPLPVLLLYSITASWLMSRYRSSQYEFGNVTVELAPFGRRALAKMVDWLLATMPILILQRIYLGSGSEMQEYIMDNFDWQMLKTIGLISFGVLVYWVSWLMVLAAMEGNWGLSPGKWLFGIRVVRTTLRPCGFFRALARGVMLIFDGTFCCFGWLPGALSIGLSSSWQRLGDMVADTIVIRAPQHDDAA